MVFETSKRKSAFFGLIHRIVYIWSFLTVKGVVFSWGQLLCTEIKDLAVGLAFFYFFFYLNMRSKACQYFGVHSTTLLDTKSLFSLEKENWRSVCGSRNKYLTNNGTNFLGRCVPYVPVLAGITVHMIYFNFSHLKISWNEGKIYAVSQLKGTRYHKHFKLLPLFHKCWTLLNSEVFGNVFRCAEKVW